MTGLFLIAVLSAWVWFAIWLTKKITRGIKVTWSRNIATTALLIAIVPLPVADELLAAPQFRKMCEEGTKLRFDPVTIRGKTIYSDGAHAPDFSFYGLAGNSSLRRYRDLQTKETVLSYSVYSIEGGWFIRALRISETNSPLVFEGSCSPPEMPSWTLFQRTYQLTEADFKDR